MPLLGIWVLWQLNHDEFGYYVDTVEFESVWIEVDTTNCIELMGWQNTGLMDILPGEFWFYGSGFDKIAICSNGWVSFQVTRTDWPMSWPDPYFPYTIAGFVQDMGVEQATICWDTIGSKLVIEYDMLPALGGELRFEIIIDVADSTITIAYKEHGVYDWCGYPGPGGSGTQPIVGIAGDTIGLDIPVYGLIHDSTAVRFFYYPYPDMEVTELIYPGDNYIWQVNVPESVVVKLSNNGPQQLDCVWVCMSLYSDRYIVYKDSVQVRGIPAGGVGYARFYGIIPDEFVDYELEVTLGGWQDMKPYNDTLRDRLKAPGGCNDTLQYDDGQITHGVYTNDPDVWLGVSYAIGVNVLLKYIAVYIISEGDTGFGEPDSSRDPIEVGVWYRVDGTWELWDSELRLRDTVSPSWVYHMPAGSLWVDTVLVGVRLKTDKGGEALGMDNAINYRGVKWIKVGEDNWQQSNYGDGDPMIRLYVYNPEVRTMEEPIDRICISNPASYIEMHKIICNSIDKLLVYDITGRLIDEVKPTDRMRVGEHLPSGVYFLVFKMSGDKKEEKVKWIKIR